MCIYLICWINNYNVLKKLPSFTQLTISKVVYICLTMHFIRAYFERIISIHFIRISKTDISASER